jgi:hypothetical protein
MTIPVFSGRSRRTAENSGMHEDWGGRDMKKEHQEKVTRTARSPAEKREYRPVRLMRVGKARQLVQGRTHGKYADAYSGYYWEG